MRTHLLLIVLFTATFAVCQASAPTALSHFDVTLVDNTVEPLRQAYQYSCNKSTVRESDPGRPYRLGTWFRAHAA